MFLVPKYDVRILIITVVKVAVGAAVVVVGPPAVARRPPLVDLQAVVEGVVFATRFRIQGSAVSVIDVGTCTHAAKMSRGFVVFFVDFAKFLCAL